MVGSKQEKLGCSESDQSSMRQKITPLAKLSDSLDRNSKEFQMFLPPQTGNEGFYYVFKWQFFQFSSKISKKKIFLRQKSKEFQRFLPPKPEMKAFIVFLSDNFFKFQAK